ncbi:MAG TPA: sigma-70 family RNA polymerase sigma factor [Roseomonas sp.]
MMLAGEMIQLLPRLLAYARGLGCREMDAPDLVKDVMLRVLEADSRIPQRRLVEADILAELRKSYISRYVLHRSARRAAPDHYAAYFQKSQREMLKIHEALRAIDPGMLECFILHTGDAMSHAEIAQALRITVPAVRSRLARARTVVASMTGCVADTMAEGLRPLETPALPNPTSASA